jgi:hypothetical protein
VTDFTARTHVGIATRILAWALRYPRALSDRLHAAADERASQYGWEITQSAGRFGFAARTYRDPRFDDRRRQLTGAVTHLTESADLGVSHHTEVEQVKIPRQWADARPARGSPNREAGE